MQKKCFFCGSKNLVKDGFIRGRQRVKCKACGKRFAYSKRLSDNKLYEQYLDGKQNVSQLASKYGKCTKTITRHLDKYDVCKGKKHHGRDVVLLMDATYTSNNFGVMVFKDNKTKDILWYKFLTKHETIGDYLEGIRYIEKHYNIVGGVCDGLRGLIQSLHQYPIQYCQFHQIKTVRTYLTQNPESEAGKELLKLAYTLTDKKKELFISEFDSWYEKHKSFVNERSKPDEKGKTHYVHKKLRSAWLSLKRNMPYLWIFYDNPELGIPNTNNGMEAVFTPLKTHLRLHNGMNREHKETFIRSFLKMSLPPDGDG